MKKLIALLCAVGLITCLLASCGDNKDTKSSSGSGTGDSSKIDVQIKDNGEVEYDTIGEESVSLENYNLATISTHVVDLKLTDTSDKEFENETVYIAQGKKMQIKYSILPADATDKNVCWSSENKETVKVDKDGFILGMKPGATTVTCTPYDKINHSDRSLTVVVIRSEGDAELSKAFLELVNSARKEAGVAEIKADDTKLPYIANQRAYEEAAENDGIMDANRPNNAGDIFEEYDLWVRAHAEMPVWGKLSAQEAFDQLTSKEENKKALLAANYDQIGVGCYKDEASGATFWDIILVQTA